MALRARGIAVPPGILALLLAVSLSFTPVLASAETVVGIEIKGNRALERESVLSRIGTEVGGDFSRERVSKDVHALYDSGFIQDVIVEKRSARGGVILTYTIKEKPMIGEVEFEGADALSDEEIDAISDLEPRSVYSPAKVREVRAKLLDEYARQGYFMARIDVEVAEVGPNTVDIIFHVIEGKKPTVKRVEIFGNEEMSDFKLRSRMTTKQEGIFTAKKYSREDFERDIMVLDFFYDDNGYLEAGFTNPERMITRDREHVILGVGVVEGPQYSVGEIRIKGDLILPEEELMEGFLLRSGDIFRKSLFLKDHQYLLDSYGNEGYALCEVEPDLKLNKEERLVDIDWYIRKGTKVYIEQINVSGNNKTYDKVVRREMTIKEGQLFSTSGARISEARIRQLGYFSDVLIAPRPGSETDRINLDVQVKEQSSGSFVFGAGVTTESEYFVSLQYQQMNFAGLGTDVSVRAMLSEETQNYSLQYSDPYFLDSNWYMGIEAFASETYYVDFIDQRTGGSFTLGRKIPHLENVRFYATYSYLTTSLDGFETDSIYRKQPDHTDIGSLTLTLDRNNLNNNLDPTDGNRQRVKIEIAGYDAFGGSEDFVKTHFETWYFTPVYRDTYLSFRGRVRHMSRPQDDTLLISERYFLGGSRSLRGYDVASVGPEFPEDDGDFTPIGGNKDILFQVEYIMPLSEELGMKLAVFYDTGNAFNDNEDMDFGDLRQDWGFGLRWMSPMGPLSFGLAFPLDPDEDDDSQQFVFSLGTNLY